MHPLALWVPERVERMKYSIERGRGQGYIVSAIHWILYNPSLEGAPYVFVLDSFDA
jgi:hypothetical protein